MQRVIVLGGGVAGMSAAHELIERGFEVEVYEKRKDIPGGKARSVPVPDSATGGRKPLPGEHGFRFFPGFYKHVTDTMSRIPFGENERGVFDNLVPANEVMLAREGKTPVVTLTRFPHSAADLKVLFDALFRSDLGLTKEDKEFFAARVWQLMTSCRERRVDEYERIGWWQYTAADSHSKAYQTLFTQGLTRTLVAAKAKEASTKTGGDIFIQLLFNMADPMIQTDRVLDGPTTDRWLDPWLDYLLKKGVDYRFDCRLKGFETGGGKITGAWVAEGSQPARLVTGDYFIAAVPVEVAAPLISEDLLKLDASLASIKQLKRDVSWMNGLQIYLNETVEINRGHVIYADSQWALTSISQVQFWKDFDVSQYGDGTVKDILSVDISSWDTPGLNGKAARDCTTNQEVFDEVWQQLKTSLNVGGHQRLRDDQVVTWYLDDDIRFFKKHTKDTEPLLVNKVNTWDLRPDAHTGIPNLFLASDYVKTYTDLATMEGANEAARRAVNGILDASGSSESLCKLWQLHEPWALSLLRWYDGRRYRQGLPWRDEFPDVARAAHAALVWFSSLISSKK